MRLYDQTFIGHSFFRDINKLIFSFIAISFLLLYVQPSTAYGQNTCGCSNPGGLSCTIPSPPCPSATICHNPTQDPQSITINMNALASSGHFVSCSWVNDGTGTPPNGQTGSDGICDFTVVNRTDAMGHDSDALGACAPPPECEVDEDCDDGLTCTDDVCNNGECSNDIIPAEDNFVCRQSTGECDPAETCNGVSGICPMDMFATPGTECTDTVFDEAPQDSGTDCTDAACDDMGMCDQSILADPLPMVCLPPSGDECEQDSDCNDGLSCTEDICVMDEPNFCDNTIISSEENFVCREADGECDVEEVCDGQSEMCPADMSAEVGTPCNDTDEDICTTATCDDMGMCDQSTPNPDPPLQCLPPPTNGDEPIPTLSEWGVIFLMAFLFMYAIWRMKKHQEV